MDGRSGCCGVTEDRGTRLSGDLRRDHTLIRHAALPGPVLPISLCVHLPTSVGRLIAGAGFPLLASSHLQRTNPTAIDLAAITSAAHQRLTEAASAQVEPANGVVGAMRSTRSILLQHRHQYLGYCG
jgi:hypothetical protein